MLYQLLAVSGLVGLGVAVLVLSIHIMYREYLITRGQKKHTHRL